MKPLKSKSQVRQEIQQQMSEFLESGGKINAYSMGDSNREPTTSPPIPHSFDGPKTERTPVGDIVNAIESRRGRKTTNAPKSRLPGRPKKKMILDDFGQPLRWEWVED